MLIENAIKSAVTFALAPVPTGPGTAIDDTITLLGGENAASGSRLPYPKYSIEEVLRQMPDVIFIGKGMGEIKELTAVLMEKLNMVPAVRNNRVCFVEDYLYRLGPRIIKGIEEVARCLDQK